MFQVLVIRGGTDVTQPLCLLGAAVLLASQNLSEPPGVSGSFSPRCSLQIVPREGVDLAQQFRLSREQDGC